MKKILLCIVLILSFVYAYTEKDWEVYNACKEKFYDNKNNGYDFEACREMLNHKDTLKQYGADSSYTYWLKRLGK
jgi:hypothetical protein